jgi:hypothetical protein
MNTENRVELLEALRAQRRRQGWVRGLLTVECPVTSCPVTGEFRVPVQETTGGRLMQPKLKCPRCGAELHFIDLQ